MRLFPSTFRHPSARAPAEVLRVLFEEHGTAAAAPQLPERPHKTHPQRFQIGFSVRFYTAEDMQFMLEDLHAELLKQSPKPHRRPHNEHKEAPPHYRRTPPCVPVVLYQPRRKAFTSQVLLRHVPSDAPQGHPIIRPAILAHAPLTHTRSAPACSARRGGLFLAVAAPPSRATDRVPRLRPLHLILRK